MKKDLSIFIVVALLIFALMFGVSHMRAQVPMRPSHPFTEALASPLAVPGKVIIRINGEPVTENEFAAAFEELPPQMQQQYNSPQGKQAFAEQFVRMKILAQEAKRMGLDRDGKVAGQLASQQTDVLAGAAESKIVPAPTPAEIRAFYDKNKDRLSTLELSHIDIAYQGGLIPPKGGAQPPTEEQAMNKALAIWQKIKSGADFAQMAREYSDDVQSAQNGGALGPVNPASMPEELRGRVLALQPGQLSDPIPTRFGIEIIKAGQRQVRPLDKELETQIAERLHQQDVVARVELLRKIAKVDYDPKMFPDAKAFDAAQRQQRPQG